MSTTRRTRGVTRIRRATIAVTGIALSVCLAGCFDSPEEHMAKGKDLAAKQDHNGAALEFKNVLQSNPRSAEARYLLGHELLEQGAYRLAEIELQRAYDARYDRDLVVPQLVKSQVLQNVPDHISPQMARSELRTPAANAELQTWLGTAALVQGKLDEALRSYRSAQNFVADYPEARIGEARVNALQGRIDTAAAELASVLLKDPKNVEGLILQGDLLRSKGDSQAALSSYLAAIKENPRNAVARIDLASVYIETRQMDAAIKQVDTLKKLAPRDPRVNYLDALIAFSANDNLRAADAIQRSLNERPADGIAQILSGAIAVAMKQPAQAEVHLLEGLRLRPDAIYARRLLADLYLRQRQPAKARDVLAPAIRAQSNDAVLIGLAGETAVQLGDYAAAGRYFELAAKLDPSNTAPRVRGAIVDLVRGDQASGLAALEAAAKDSPTNPSPDIALVITHLNHKQYDKALAAWTNLQKQAPNDPITYNLRAAIDFGRKDNAGARKALEHALQIQPTYLPAAENLAMLFASENNVDAARRTLRTIIDKDPKEAMAVLDLAQLEMTQNSPPNVVLPLFQQARTLAPRSTQVIVGLVGYHLSQGNPREALSVAQDALNSAPQNVALLGVTADLQLSTGQVDPALNSYRQLVSLRPDAAEYQIGLAQAMVAANQVDLAVPVFVNAIKAKPDTYSFEGIAISSLINAHRTEEANRMLAEIRRLAPKSPVLPELEGDVKMATRQYPDAAAAYRKLLQQDSPPPRLAPKLYVALEMAGNLPEAKAFLADWLKSHPKDALANTLDAEVAMQARDYAHAAKSYKLVLAAQPHDGQVLNNLAWVLSQLKDPEAASFAEQATKVAPNRADFSDTFGWILVEQGDVARGREVLERASAAAPKQADIALHLAKAQIKDGRKDAARTTLQALIKTAPTSPEAKESKELMATL